MHQIPDGKLLSGNFMTINHSFATALGKNQANVYLENFVNELISTGFVANSIQRHQIKGLIAIRG